MKLCKGKKWEEMTADEKLKNLQYLIRLMIYIMVANFLIITGNFLIVSERLSFISKDMSSWFVEVSDNMIKDFDQVHRGNLMLDNHLKDVETKIDKINTQTSTK